MHTVCQETLDATDFMALISTFMRHIAGVDKQCGSQSYFGPTLTIFYLDDYP